MENQLFDTKELQNKLSSLASNAKEIVIISAYITDSAINWMLEKIPKTSSVCVIAKLSPQDLASGASTFDAIRNLLNNGHEIKLLANLHAKIYLIDKKDVFVGSANLTSNGLKLFGNGNIEASIKTNITPDILEFINNIRTKSIEITFDILDKMEREIKVCKSEHMPLQWDDEIIKPVLHLWTVDMFQDEVNTTNIINKDDRILLFGNTEDNNANNIENCFKETKVYKWLISKLKEEKDRGLSFGAISEKLHNEINDNPAPYRKTIKQYVKCLLSYCKLFALDEIEISRSNYSEIIKLKDCDNLSDSF